MSSAEEIKYVYESDIYRMTSLVLQRRGAGALLEGASGMHVESLYGRHYGDGDRVQDFRTTRERD